MTLLMRHKCPNIFSISTCNLNAFIFCSDKTKRRTHFDQPSMSVHASHATCHKTQAWLKRQTIFLKNEKMKCNMSILLCPGRLCPDYQALEDWPYDIICLAALHTHTTNNIHKQTMLTYYISTKTLFLFLSLCKLAHAWGQSIVTDNYRPQGFPKKDVRDTSSPCSVL